MYMFSPVVEDWLDTMEKLGSTRAALANLYYDTLTNRISRATARELLAFVATEWPVRKPRGGDPAKLIRAFAATHPHKYLCSAKPRPKDLTACSRIMDAKSFLDHNLAPGPAAVIYEDDVPDAELERLETMGLVDVAKGSMRGADPYAWITPTPAVDAARAGGGAFPNHVRDRLGLLARVRQEKLIEIRYPPTALGAAKVAAPTALEGSDVVFRSRKRRDGWGRTVDLASPAHADGEPEAVHTEIAFTSEFQVRRVGRLTKVALAFDWDEFATTFPRPWTSASRSHFRKLMATK